MDLSLGLKSCSFSDQLSSSPKHFCGAAWWSKMYLSIIPSGNNPNLSQTAHIQEFPWQVQACMFLDGQWGLLEPGKCKRQLKCANPSGWICGFKPQQGHRKFEDVLVASYTKMVVWNCGFSLVQYCRTKAERCRFYLNLTKPFTNMKGQITLLFWAD